MVFPCVIEYRLTVRISVYNKNLEKSKRNIISSCQNSRLDKVTIAESDKSSGLLFTHTWKNVTRLEWMLTSTNARITILQGDEYDCFRMRSWLLTEKALFVPTLIQGKYEEAESMKEDDKLLYFPAR